MSPGRRSGPDQSPSRRDEVAAAVSTTVPAGTVRVDATALGADLRRRRLASLACEPLPCGRRDPLDVDRRQSGDNQREAWRQTWATLAEQGLLSEHLRAFIAEQAKGAA